ncbi:hypothetical protein MNV49_004379 [Pseudohyphozyma bogoriensis]|nr:hypothetical protein MNV49_004379 [Pseudohyphozyma bogoriensis]
MGPPLATSGKIILIANVWAKGDELKVLLANCRRQAEGEEANTLTYRTTRSETDPDHFLVIEEYQLPDGWKEHKQGSELKVLLESEIIEKLESKYFEEFY